MVPFLHSNKHSYSTAVPTYIAHLPKQIKGHSSVTGKIIIECHLRTSCLKCSLDLTLVASPLFMALSNWVRTLKWLQTSETNGWQSVTISCWRIRIQITNHAPEQYPVRTYLIINSGALKFKFFSV